MNNLNVVAFYVGVKDVIDSMVTRVRFIDSFQGKSFRVQRVNAKN